MGRGIKHVAITRKIYDDEYESKIYDIVLVEDKKTSLKLNIKIEYKPEDNNFIANLQLDDKPVVKKYVSGNRFCLDCYKFTQKNFCKYCGEKTH